MNVIDSDLLVQGNIIISGGGTIALPANAVGNTQVSAASPLTVDKSVQQINCVYAQKHGAVVADDTGTFIHGALAAGVVHSIQAWVRVIPVGAATVTVDLKKNGTTVLTAVITLDSGNVAYTVEIGAITTTAYVAGDFFEVVIDATAGGGTLPQGLGVEVVFRETAQP